MRRTAKAAAETRDSLLRAGVPYFAKQPYSGASLEVLAGRLGVTRGAIYHHFGSKRGYFGAVVEAVMAALRDRVVAAADGAGGGWTGLRAGCDVFLEAAADDAFRQIVLIDAPAVLGWDVWKAIDDRTTAQSLRDGLAELSRDGVLATADVEGLTAAVSGAMNELSLWIATQAAPAAALVRARAVVRQMLRAFEA